VSSAVLRLGVANAGDATTAYEITVVVEAAGQSQQFMWTNGHELDETGLFHFLPF
jgi:hypothetical protein